MDLQLLAEDAAASADASAAVTTETPEAAFDRLIEGDYRAQYEAKTASLREKSERYDAAEPLIRHLAERCGMAEPDAGKLLEFMQHNEAARAEAARQRDAGLHERAQALQKRWDEQAEQARELFPHLELRQELQNARFRALLCGGVDVATAYQAVHLQELLPAAMAYTAKAVEQKLAASTVSTRPGENGAGGTAAAASRPDPKHMDKQSFRALCRRVESGERICL